MTAHIPRLSSIFTVEYAKRINTQIVYPAQSVVVKPNELESALARPLHSAYYEPEKTASHLAATLSYGIIKGHPFIFMGGNKRTAFFLANEYIRAMGIQGLADSSTVGKPCEHAIAIAELHMDVAAGILDLADFSNSLNKQE